jgi:5-methylcytosine-specific restriction endonuclease McrA
MYERRGTYSVEHITSLIRSDDEKVLLDGEMVKTGSDRYKLFAKNRYCVTCGTEGLYYAMERTVKRRPDGTVTPMSQGFHFNLYGKNADGEEVMITKDHIVPKSKGGPNRLDNYQTMCFICNVEKGNRHENS